MMTPDLLTLASLFSLSACLPVRVPVSGGTEQVEALSGGDCTLTCTAEYKAGVQYSAISWYKLRGRSSHHRNGLLRSDLNGTTLRYVGMDREMELLEDSHAIFLPNVTCSDSGVYLCRLSAPVGEQNREGRVLLTLTDCPAHLTDLLTETEDSPIDPSDFPADRQRTETNLVMFATVCLIVALVICVISYKCTKNTFKDIKQQQTTKKEIFLDAPLKPLKKKDLKLIYTLGPKPPTVKQILV